MYHKGSTDIWHARAKAPEASRRKGAGHRHLFGGNSFGMTHRQPMTALITGGAKRIGRGVALHLARAGMDVAIHYHRSRAEAQELVAEMEGLGRRAVAIPGDLRDAESTAGLVPSAAGLLGPIHLLVNSASSFNPSTLLDFSLDELVREIEINAYAPLVLARSLARQGGKGAVVNLLDSRINSYDATHVAYHLSKRMLYSVTRMLALELAPKIRVNGVAPGLILPPEGEPETYLEEHKEENLLLRHGSVEGVAKAVKYLAEAEFVTGQLIYVDGGRNLRSSVYG